MRADLLKRMGRLGFGAASLGNLGRAVSDVDASAALEAALGSGITYYDTAPFYGLGLSERRLGDALRGRDDLIVSTKVGRLLRPAPDVDTRGMRDGFVTSMPFAPVFDYTYDGVMRSHEASLQRLGLARVDILYVHDIGRRTHGPAHERHWRNLFDGGGYRALDELRVGGAVRAIGLGVNEWEACVDAMEQGRFDLLMLAGRYTLLDQGSLARFMPAVQRHGARVVGAGVYNSGILATGSAGTPAYDYQPAPPTIIARTRAIEAVCAYFAVPLAAAALQFVLAHPLVISVVPGLASARRVAQTRALMEHPIAPAFWAALRERGLVDVAAPVPA